MYPRKNTAKSIITKLLLPLCSIFFGKLSICFIFVGVLPLPSTLRLTFFGLQAACFCKFKSWFLYYFDHIKNLFRLNVLWTCTLCGCLIAHIIFWRWQFSLLSLLWVNARSVILSARTYILQCIYVTKPQFG